jgi:hypothetical protein
VRYPWVERAINALRPFSCAAPEVGTDQIAAHSLAEAVTGLVVPEVIIAVADRKAKGVPTPGVLSPHNGK